MIVIVSTSVELPGLQCHDSEFAPPLLIPVGLTKDVASFNAVLQQPPLTQMGP